jgi:Tol biopolymer transport system component
VNGTLFAVSPDSGKAKRIGKPAWGDASVEVRSADGQYLVASTAGAAGMRVVRFDLSTGEMQRLGPFGGPGDVTGPVDVSPDDRQVVTSVKAATLVPVGSLGGFTPIDGPLRLETTTLASGAIRPLIPPFQPVRRQYQYIAGHTAFYMPDSVQRVSWSPDGRQIAFVHKHRWDVVDGAADAAYHRLMIVPADGSAPARELTRAFDEGSTLSWSPDSRRLVVQTAGAVELVDAASSAPRVIARGKHISGPLLSPSGRRLAYRAQRKRFGPGRLKIRTLATGATVTPGLVKGRLGHSFSWAPREDRLVASDDKGLAVVSATGKLRRLPGTRGLSGPSWGRSQG